MEKKELLNELEETLKLVESLPDGRRFFYNTGIIFIELTKEETIAKLKEEINKLKLNLDKHKEVKK
jgi:chaperonin cofactor prefoldin